jgi:hypothetical protein
MTVNPEIATLLLSIDFADMPSADWPVGSTVHGEPLTAEQIALCRSASVEDFQAAYGLAMAEAQRHDEAVDAMERILVLLEEHTTPGPDDVIQDLIDRCPPHVVAEIAPSGYVEVPR